MSLTAIEPGLLLAAPRLGDSSFGGSVVLLGLHDEDGSLGWTINGEAVGEAAAVVRATGRVFGDQVPSGFTRPALRGGPVSPETVWILYRRPSGADALPGSITIGAEIAVTAAAAALETLLAGGGPPEFRLLVGYAGWGPGQLERELARGAWLPTAADAELVFDGETETLWRRAYESAIGTGPAAFVSTTRGSA